MALLRGRGGYLPPLFLISIVMAYAEWPDDLATMEPVDVAPGHSPARLLVQDGHRRGASVDILEEDSAVDSQDESSSAVAMLELQEALANQTSTNSTNSTNSTPVSAQEDQQQQQQVEETPQDKEEQLSTETNAAASKLPPITHKERSAKGVAKALEEKEIDAKKHAKDMEKKMLGLEREHKVAMEKQRNEKDVKAQDKAFKESQDKAKFKETKFKRQSAESAAKHKEHADEKGAKAGSTRGWSKGGGAEENRAVRATG